MLPYQTAHGAETPDAGFSITVQPQSVLGEYNIVLSKQKNPIHGVLIYVVAEGQETHIGTFAPKEGFKEVASCTGATITHSDDTEKTDTIFKWTAPSANGSYEVKAVVVGRKTRWQSLSTAFGIPDEKSLGGPSAPKRTLADSHAAKGSSHKETKAKETKANSLPCATSQVPPHASVPTEPTQYKEVPKYDDKLPETTQYEKMNIEVSDGLKLTVEAMSVLAILLAF